MLSWRSRWWMQVRVGLRLIGVEPWLLPRRWRLAGVAHPMWCGADAKPSDECAAAGAVPLLVLSVQEPELSLKAVAASALSDISKHSPELAQAVSVSHTSLLAAAARHARGAAIAAGKLATNTGLLVADANTNDAPAGSGRWRCHLPGAPAGQPGRQAQAPGTQGSWCMRDRRCLVDWRCR